MDWKDGANFIKTKYWIAVFIVWCATASLLEYLRFSE